MATGGVTYKKVGKNQLDDTEDDIEMYDVKTQGNNDTEITEDNNASITNNNEKNHDESVNT